MFWTTEKSGCDLIRRNIHHYVMYFERLRAHLLWLYSLPLFRSSRLKCGSSSSSSLGGSNATSTPIMHCVPRETCALDEFNTKHRTFDAVYVCDHLIQVYSHEYYPSIIYRWDLCVCVCDDMVHKKTHVSCKTTIGSISISFHTKEEKRMMTIETRAN